jgi:hypothetical protein
MWSIGCCLFELATGKILFPGRTNNEMLFLQLEVTGPAPKMMMMKGQFVAQHFDEQGNFQRALIDKATKKVIHFFGVYFLFFFFFWFILFRHSFPYLFVSSFLFFSFLFFPFVQ